MKKLFLCVAFLCAAMPAWADGLGDFAVGSIIDLRCDTGTTSSGPAAVSSGAISVYKNNSTTETTTGVTLTTDFDGRSGSNHVRIDTSADGTFYSAGSHFQVTWTGGTVGGISIANYTCESFTLEKESALRPATAGRTLIVSAGGAADSQVKGLDNDTITAAVMANNSIGPTEIATDAFDADALAASAVTEIAAGLTIPTVSQIADGVWDEPTPHNTAGTMGQLLTAAGAASDPLLNLVPGSYANGTAGYALGRLGVGAGVTVNAPVNPITQALTVKQGDDYSNLDNAPIDFSYSGTYDPSSPTSLTLRIYSGATEVAAYTGTVVGASSPWTLRFQPTAAQTILLPAGAGYRYDIEVLKNARKRTLGEGTCEVKVN